MRGNRGVAPLCAAIVLAFGADASAHRRDEYLHAARIAIEPDRVRLELNLTPGIAVADLIIREIDQDGDDELSPNEQQAYATRVLDAISLHVDDGQEPLILKVTGSTFPGLNAMRNGDGSIAIQSDLLVTPLANGVHRLWLRSNHAAEHNVYLANALVPANDHVTVTGQRRDEDQRELTVDFVVRGTAAVSGRRWVWINLAVGVVMVTPLIRRTRMRRAWRREEIYGADHS